MRVHWFKDTLTSGVMGIAHQFSSESQGNIIARVVDEHVPEVESYGKSHARWSDRTGMARAGLTAKSFHQGGDHGITFYHTVDYGIWLEVRWNGKYAIILQTIDVQGKVLMKKLEGALAKRPWWQFWRRR